MATPPSKLRIYLVYSYAQTGSYYDSDRSLEYYDSGTDMAALYRKCKKRIVEERDNRIKGDILLVDGDSFDYHDHPDSVIFFTLKVDPGAKKVYVLEQDREVVTDLRGIDFSTFTGRISEFAVVEGKLVYEGVICTNWYPPPVGTLLKRHPLEGESGYITFPGQSREELDKLISLIPEAEEAYKAKTKKELEETDKRCRLQRDRTALMSRICGRVEAMTSEQLQSLLAFLDDRR